MTKSIQKYSPEAEGTQIIKLDKRPRIWKYLSIKESDTTGTTGTASHTLAGNSTSKKEKRNTKAYAGCATCASNNLPPSQQQPSQTLPDRPPSTTTAYLPTSHTRATNTAAYVKLAISLATATSAKANKPATSKK